MFKEMVINSVVFNEVDEVATQSFIKTFALNNQKELNIEQKGDKFYVIKKGKSKEFTVSMIKDTVEKAIIGKTIKEVYENSKLIMLIENLNLIKETTLVSNDDVELELF